MLTEPFHLHGVSVLQQCGFSFQTRTIQRENSTVIMAFEMFRSLSAIAVVACRDRKSATILTAPTADVGRIL